MAFAIVSAPPTHVAARVEVATPESKMNRPGVSGG